MRRCRAAVAVLLVAAVTAGCSQVPSSSDARSLVESTDDPSLESTSLPGDAGCDEVMAWTRDGWNIVQAIGTSDVTAEQAQSLRSLADQSRDLAVRTEDPLLSLIAAIGAADTLIAKGERGTGARDIRTNATTYLERIAEICKAQLR